MDNFEESEIPWMAEELLSQSTSLPEIIAEESNEIGTLVIFVISAILAITALFVIAVFIDCRQQKLTKHQNKRRRVLKVKLPIVNRPLPEDEDTFADKMCVEPSIPSSSNIV